MTRTSMSSNEKRDPAYRPIQIQSPSLHQGLSGFPNLASSLYAGPTLEHKQQLL